MLMPEERPKSWSVGFSSDLVKPIRRPGECPTVQCAASARAGLERFRSWWVSRFARPVGWRRQLGFPGPRNRLYRYSIVSLVLVTEQCVLGVGQLSSGKSADHLAVSFGWRTEQFRVLKVSEVDS